jgi:two-component system LytT family response regulator
MTASEARALSTRALRVLIVDDEALARQRLEDLLRLDAGVEIVGAADNGDAAINAIRTLKPDLVFLDVQMPGKTGFEVVREIGAERMPVTIFVTAYDQYALRAFEVAALDYLVKPFDDERFELAVQRARRILELEDVGRLSDQLLAVLQGEGRAPRKTEYLERIAVEMRGEKTFLIRERMQTLEERLDPAKFFRVHRSAIVRLEQIETLLRDPGGDYAVRLKSGAQLSVSRSRVEPLELWMGVPR